MPRRAILRVIVLLLCAVGAAVAQAPRIIDNPRPTWTPAQQLRLSAKPTLVIGENGGAMSQFSRVWGVARLTDGRIVVADGGSRSLRFFDARGKYLKSAGGPGEGPGEFNQEFQFFTATPGDTLVAGLPRGELNTFTGTGQFVRRIPALQRPGPPPPPPGASAAPTSWTVPVTFTVLDGGGTRLVGRIATSHAPRSGSGRWTDSFPISLVDGRNTTVSQLGRMPFAEFAMHEGEPTTAWLGAMPTFATDGTTLYVGYGSEYAIRAYDTKGTLQQVIRRAWTPAPLTKKDIDTYVGAWMKRWNTDTGAKAAAQLAELRGLPYTATVPAFGQFIVDRTGRLWVREPHVVDFASVGWNRNPLVPSTWSVFDRGGRWLGDVGMPAHFLPYEIGADFVIGIARDEDGVQTVAVYGLGAGKP